MGTPSIPKIVIFVILIVAVMGGIFYLNSQKIERGRTEVVTIEPRTPPEPSVTSSAGQNRDAKNKNVMPRKLLSTEDKSKRYELAKEITTSDGFINTDGKPITIGEFVGKKVILIDFWTYSCINCQRTTPYLNAWYEKYKDKGFVIIGLHTPEFEFEKVYQNVLEATKRMEIQYPVVLDNDYSTWNAYQNRFWPRKYLIDIDGYVVYDHIGEGGYEETEQAIQKALKERIQVLGTTDAVDSNIVQPKDMVDVQSSHVRSPEMYFGSARNEYLYNGSSGVMGVQVLTVPASIDSNVLYLGGSWDFQSEFSKNTTIGKIVLKYNAKDVYFVASSDTGVTLRILRDGKLLSKDLGADVSKDGTVFIKDNRLYKLIQASEYAEHTIEIQIDTPGLHAFAFTFG